MNQAAFLDRDGVINRKAAAGEYITRWEEMEILPGVAEAIGRLRRAGYRVMVITNQRCVAKGLMTGAQLESLHERLGEGLARAGAAIDDFYYCPHEEQPACGCRKPQPGMLLAAAREHGVDLQASWMVGDSEKDIVAGRRAGCRTARIAEPKIGAEVSAKIVRAKIVSANLEADGQADVIAASLREAVEQILKLEAVALRQMGTFTYDHH